MRIKMVCPVCCTANIRTYYTDCIGVVEDAYNCENCGYFSYMAYSPVSEGIYIPEGKTEEEIIEKFGKRIAELDLAIIPSECFP